MSNERLRPPRVAPNHPLAIEPWWERVRFRISLAARRLFTARQAWRLAGESDDAGLAVALVRHGIVPSVSSGCADDDWLCQRLIEALSDSRTEPSPTGGFSRDPESGLSVAGALLAAGANPATHYTGFMESMHALTFAVARGRIEEAREMIATDPHTPRESGAFSKLLRIEWMAWLDRPEDRMAWLGRVAKASRKSGAVVRWEAFKYLLQAVPENLRSETFNLGEVLVFFRETGLREPMEWVLRSGLWSPCNLLAGEVAGRAGPDVVDMLLREALAGQPDGRLPHTVLHRALATYSCQPNTLRQGPFPGSIHLLAGLTRNLAATEDGKTLTHALACNAGMAADRMTAPVMEALRAAGLPDQTGCRDWNGRTPLEAMEACRLDPDISRHVTTVLTAAAQAERLSAATTAPARRPRRRA